MEKIKCVRMYEKEGGYVMAYGVPEGKSIRSNIICVAGYTQAQAEALLEQAIVEMPPKFAAKYTF